MRVRRISLSTGQTLSILTSAVVIAVLAVGVSVTWAALRGSAVETAQDRMTRGVRQLAANSANNFRLQQARYAAVTADPAIRRALKSPSNALDLGAGPPGLSKLKGDPGPGLPVELGPGQGRPPVAFV